MFGNYYGHMGMFGFGFGFGWIFTILFWALIIWAIYALIENLTGHSHNQHHHDQQNTKMSQENSALNILKERYAKGEISKEQFDQMKKDLE